MQKDFLKGRKYQVIKPGILSGWSPVQGGMKGFSQPMDVGAVLTCDGVSMSSGDGVPVVKWLDENGGHIAIDCEFRPSVGSMWSSFPHPGHLELVA